MRIDPKYFNLFIGICALITVLVIIFSTIRYSQKQVVGFQENLAEVQLDTLAFKSFSSADSLFIHDTLNEPAIIQFWSTWSGKSQYVNEFLHNYSSDHPNLLIIAAAVRDGEEQINEYINNKPFTFHYVDGTAFYQSLLVPGIPTQILIKKNGELYTTHIGDDTEQLQEKLNRLLSE